jgi:hypothetical protein
MVINSHSTIELDDNQRLTPSPIDIIVPGSECESLSIADEINQANLSSTFYLSSAGELNSQSLQMPTTSTAVEIVRSAENFLEKIADQTQSIVEDFDRTKMKHRLSFRLPSFNAKKTPCEQCKEVFGFVCVFDQIIWVFDQIICVFDLIIWVLVDFGTQFG